MKHPFRTLLVLILALALLVSALPAAGAQPMQKPASGRIHAEHPGSRSVTDAYLAAKDRGVKTALPARYNSNELGYVTPVRDQNPYGTCWAHGAMASVESYMIKHGIADASTGSAASADMNLSEYQLAWYNYTYAYDALGMLTGDRTEPYYGYLDLGGFGEMATYTLMRWEGPASESTGALAYDKASPSGLGADYAYQYNVAHVTDVDWIPTCNMDAVKQAIVEYGAGTLGYCHEDDYGNDDTGAYCFIQTAEPGDSRFEYANHDVTVVGWDDNYSRMNFNSICRPTNDGAWIVKNSWSDGLGDGGYYYISYEDSASLQDTCYFYKVAALDNYDNIYQYDGTNNFSACLSFCDLGVIATSFTAGGSEILQAVALCTWDEGVDYTLKIYTDGTAGDPLSGTLAGEQTGSITFSGYHTIELETPITLTAGQRYTAVFELEADELYLPYDVSGESEGYVKWTHTAHPGTSFFLGGDDWEATPDGGSFRIKAYTKNVDDHVHNYVDGVCTVCGAKDPDSDPEPECPFTDVDPKGYYYEPMLWAVENGVTAGTSATTFSPGRDCTRGQVVTFLWRAFGEPEPTVTAHSFTDVDAGKFYYKAMLWAVENGVTSGTGQTSFSPDRACTRGQVVTFLWRAKGKPAAEGSGIGDQGSGFTDVEETAFYYEAMLWAVSAGVTTGTSATAFSPNKPCTRGQVVTFLYRAMK